jgi:hypothetical protein
MRARHAFWILVGALALAACGNPRDKELPLDLSADRDARATFEQLTPTEQQAISAYEVRRAARLAQGDEAARKAVTYRQAIADEMVFETTQAQQMAMARVTAQRQQVEEDAKAATAKAQAEADRHRLETAIACQLKSKSIVPVPNADTPVLPMPMASYDLACRNAGGADVRGFRGNILIKGPFGEWVAALPIRRDEALTSGGTFDEKISQGFINLADGMNGRQFHDVPVEKMATQVELDSLILSDGRLISKQPF